MSKEITKRIKQLESLEMGVDLEYQSFVGKKEYNRDFNVHIHELAYFTDEAWEETVRTLTEELKDRLKNVPVIEEKEEV